MPKRVTSHLRPKPECLPSVEPLEDRWLFHGGPSPRSFGFAALAPSGSSRAPRIETAHERTFRVHDRSDAGRFGRHESDAYFSSGGRAREGPPSRPPSDVVGRFLILRPDNGSLGGGEISSFPAPPVTGPGPSAEGEVTPLPLILSARGGPLGPGRGDRLSGRDLSLLVSASPEDRRPVATGDLPDVEAAEGEGRPVAPPGTSVVMASPAGLGVWVGNVGAPPERDGLSPLERRLGPTSPEASESIPGLPEPGGRANEPALFPLGANLLTEGITWGVTAAERAVRALAEPMFDPGARGGESLYWLGVSSWLLAAALACEAARRLPRRAGLLAGPAGFPPEGHA